MIVCLISGLDLVGKLQSPAPNLFFVHVLSKLEYIIFESHNRVIDFSHE